MNLNFRNITEELGAILYIFVGIIVGIYVYLNIVDDFLIALACATFWPFVALYYMGYKLIIYFWSTTVVPWWHS